MPHSSRSLIRGLIACALIPTLAYVFLQTFPGHNTMWTLPRFHFYVVSATLILATISSVLIGWTGVRSRDVNVLMLSMALLSLSGFFLIHGLSTPGFIIANSHHLMGVSGQIALTTCAVWILLSTLPSDHAFIRYISRYRGKVVVGWLALIVAINIAALAHPSLFDSIPVDIAPLNYIVAVLTIGLYVLAAKRYFNQHQVAGFPLQSAVTLGAVLLSVTEYIMVTTMMWTLAWWLYHVVLVASTVTLLYGVIAQYKSNASITKTFHRMFSTNPKERLRVGISSSMQNLIAATEEKDMYTAGHNLRVAMYALQLAEELQLGTESLRALVRGGLIHDVGKIKVPGSILNKPSSLIPEERPSLSSTR